MSQVISFQGYTPTARYDDVAWETARVEEGDTVDGPWTQIDEITLDPVDADPSAPQERNLTTAEASDAPSLWYRIIFADSNGDVELPTDPVRNGPGPTGGNLCTLQDVIGYIPGYDSDPVTDTKLEALIEAQSQLILDETGREIVGPDTNPATRRFDIDAPRTRTRRIDVGDLASDEDLVVTLLARDLTTVEVVDAAEFELLYDGERYPDSSWAPITAIRFPWALGGPVFLSDMTLEVTGTWGFPEVPAFIREACAGRVLLRYFNDVANAGTALSDAIDNVNLGALFVSAEDALAALTAGQVFA